MQLMLRLVSFEKKQASIHFIFINESIEFVKEWCLLGFKISTDVLNRNIDATIQTFYRNCNEV